MPFDPEHHAPRFAKFGWLLAIGGAVVGGWVGIPVAVVGVSALLLACYSSKDGFLLFGPIPAAEWNRTARRGRPWLWRAVYAVAAGAIVVGNLNTYGGFAEAVPRGRVTYIAEQVGNWFAACLFLYVGVLAVQVYATAIPDDRVAKRWDVLRTTDLRPREVVFGKLLGKAPVLAEPLLTATPVLTLLPLFGGVSAWFPAAVLGCCAAAAVGLGGVATFYSVFARTGGQAIRWTVILTVVYLFVSGIVYGVTNRMAKTGLPGVAARGGELFAAGNPFIAFAELSRPNVTEDDLQKLAGRFVLFHIAAGVLFALVAVRRLPRAEEWDMRPAPKPKLVKVSPRVFVLKTPPAVAPVLRPPVGDQPLVWWERFGWLNKGQADFVQSVRYERLKWIFVVSLLVGVVITGGRLLDPRNDFWRGSQMVVAALAVVGLVIGGFVVTTLPLFRAARCVARERTADTLDNLRTALSAREVLYQKWLGVLLSEWPAYSFLLATTAPLIITGVVHPIGGVIYLLGIVAVAAAFVAVGLAVSVRVRTPLRGTVVVALGLVVAVLGLGTVLGRSPPTQRVFAASALLPPIAGMNVITEAMGRVRPRADPPPLRYPLLAAAGCGILGWGLLAVVVWERAVRRLEREREG
jgi:MFS family permease